MATPNMPLWEVFIRSRNGLAHKHVGSLHATDAPLALQAARDIYTRRGEGLSIWVVPSSAITASDPAEKGMMFDPAANPRSTAIRRSTTCRTKSGICDRCTEPPILRRSNTACRRLDIGLRNTAGAVRAAPGRRCADPGPSAVGMVRPCADDGRRHGACQYGPRSARPGARIVFLRRQARRPRTTKTSSPICAMSGSTAICCCSSSRTAISRAPWCGSSSMPALPISIGGR